MALDPGTGALPCFRTKTPGVIVEGVSEGLGLSAKAGRGDEAGRR